MYTNMATARPEALMRTDADCPLLRLWRDRGITELAAYIYIYIYLFIYLCI